jgi:hypothetical protein
MPIHVVFHAVALETSADIPRTPSVLFVRPDFVGSKRELSPNRARHVFSAIGYFKKR